MLLLGTRANVLRLAGVGIVGLVPGLEGARPSLQ